MSMVDGAGYRIIEAGLYHSPSSNPKGRGGTRQPTRGGGERREQQYEASFSNLSLQIILSSCKESYSYVLIIVCVQVKHVCQVAEEMQRMGKCIVIGLQSTGEARTLEAVEVSQSVILLIRDASLILILPDIQCIP